MLKNKSVHNPNNYRNADPPLLTEGCKHIFSLNLFSHIVDLKIENYNM